MRAHTITTTRPALLLSLLALVLASTTEAASPDTTTEATASQAGVPFQLKGLKRDANKWARLFAVHSCNRYMGQTLCERISPVSAAFQRSFADATIEGIKYKGIQQVRRPEGYIYVAAVRYSNGVVVVFAGGRPELPMGPGSCVWNLADVNHNRRFIRAARASAAG
jgi:hypothetical protein